MGAILGHPPHAPLINPLADPRAVALAVLGLVAVPSLHAETCPYVWLCIGDASAAAHHGSAPGANALAINGNGLTNRSIAIGDIAGYGSDPTQNTGAITLGGYSSTANSLSAGIGSNA